MNKKMIETVNACIDELLAMTDDELLDLEEPEGYKYIDDIFEMVEEARTSLRDCESDVISCDLENVEEEIAVEPSVSDYNLISLTSNTTVRSNDKSEFSLREPKSFLSITNSETKYSSIFYEAA